MESLGTRLLKVAGQTDLVGFKNNDPITKTASESVLSDEECRNGRKVAANAALSFREATQMLKSARDRVQQRIVGRMLMDRVGGDKGSDSTLTVKTAAPRKNCGTGVSGQKTNVASAPFTKSAIALNHPDMLRQPPQTPPQPQYPPQQAMYPAARPPAAPMAQQPGQPPGQVSPAVNAHGGPAMAGQIGGPGTGLDAPQDTRAAAMPGTPGHKATNFIDQQGGLDPRGMTIDGNNAAGTPKDGLMKGAKVQPGDPPRPGESLGDILMRGMGMDLDDQGNIHRMVRHPDGTWSRTKHANKYDLSKVQRRRDPDGISQQPVDLALRGERRTEKTPQNTVKTASGGAQPRQSEGIDAHRDQTKSAKSSFKYSDKDRLYYFEGRNTPAIAPNEEEARKRSRRGGQGKLIADREPTDSERRSMQKGRWIRTRADGKSPRKSELGKGRGYGPPRKKVASTPGHRGPKGPCGPAHVCTGRCRVDTPGMNITCQQWDALEKAAGQSIGAPRFPGTGRDQPGPDGTGRAKSACGDMLAFLAAKRRGKSDKEADREAAKGLKAKKTKTKKKVTT